MIDNDAAVKLIDGKRGDAVIIATMNANNVNFGLPSLTTKQTLDFPVSGAMGKASSVGLGLALAQPDRKVMVLDGDGSLLMNLGTMVTVANKTPGKPVPRPLRQRCLRGHRRPAGAGRGPRRLGDAGSSGGVRRDLLF